jgi:syntaxin-binding protein 1
VGSVRTNKSTTWARGGSRAAGGAGSGPSAVFSGGSQLFAGRRLVVFVLGGITRGEMRAVHQLAKKHGRDVLLVSTAVLKPSSAVNQLAQMNAGSM